MKKASRQNDWYGVPGWLKGFVRVHSCTTTGIRTFRQQIVVEIVSTWARVYPPYPVEINWHVIKIRRARLSSETDLDKGIIIRRTRKKMRKKRKKRVIKISYNRVYKSCGKDVIRRANKDTCVLLLCHMCCHKRVTRAASMSRLLFLTFGWSLSTVCFWSRRTVFSQRNGRHFDALNLITVTRYRQPIAVAVVRA